MSKQNNEKKRTSSFKLILLKLFGVKHKELDILEEEAMQSPTKTVVNNFLHNKVSMTALIVFIAMFVFVLLGPIFFPISMNDSEETQTNVSPGLNLMKVPDALAGNIRDMDTGSTFSVGVDNNGKVYVWGKTKISKAVDVSDIPDDMGNVISVAAGYDHIMALNDEGKVFCWGNNRQSQAKTPRDAYKSGKIIQIEAGYQISYALTDEGNVVYWGNENLNDIRVTVERGQGELVQIAVAGTTLMGLKEDGTVTQLGATNSDVSSIPDDLTGVTQIAGTASNVAAVLEDGSVVVWGSKRFDIKEVPEMDGAVTKIIGGRYHFTALTENGTVYGWGDDEYGEASVPAKATNIENIYGGYYQNYAVTTDGNLVKWGLKGYLLGSDDLGRDVLSRLVNGGRMTMSIGAISVVISTVIGVIVGGISGFFGGWVDMILQRITEIVASLPFLPFCMILTTIIGNKISDNGRIFLIMVILGVLSWPSLCRLVRAQVLSEREQEFVTAAKAMGVKQFAIVFKHIIPNVVSVIIVSATLDFASCMLTESSLSYLGFGVKLPRPTWGNMLYGCNDSVVIQNYWWRWVFAAIALSICVICINLVGDGLRDAIDPKSNDQ